MTERRILIIAGPNGAGKTTFAREFLPNEAGCRNFVNADLIAAGLSPFSPETAARQAARVMLDTIALYVRHDESFVFETTLAGKAYLHRIEQWRAMTYKVTLLFLSLPDAQLAIDRVTNRVKEGGHHIPEAVIRRRFDKGWRNFQDFYKQAVDDWALFDNSGYAPLLQDWSENYDS
ncbi:MAG: AAA family ATPase [Pseudomonadales bacterium]|nr:AAA family ATPase [Pseudomonadales bacterium]